nr:hypothetical protein [Tanacetum cinerariifolium]
MKELLQAPTNGVGDAIVVPPVLASQFELKIGLLNLVTAISFHGFENDDPYSYIRRSNQTWLEKEPLNSIITWNDLVSKFMNQFFPPSRTINLRPQKLRDPEKFLIPCVLQVLEVCNSLADSAENAIVKVDKFNFLADFVIVDFEADPRVPIIFGRSFLYTTKALVDLYEEKLTLRIGNEELVFRAEIFSKNSPSRERHSVHSINIIDYSCEEISSQNKQSSGSTTSHSNLSLPCYESFCFHIDHQEEKSSGSSTSHIDHSLPDYETFCFDHQEEKRSGSTTSHSNPSLFEYESYFDLLIDTLPPADRSDSHHEEFADELAHIISSPKYNHFYFDIKADHEEMNRLLKENISSKINEDNELKLKIN